MGHSSKKKKKRGGRRSQPKDHHSIVDDGSEILTEEITALCAIFQDDFKVISESPPLINIKLRPYSKDTGYEDSDISALLSVRCLQGYPYKCPKLLIVPEKGLTKTDADNLLSLLYDQANSNAREGRVMIYNLVEAAQEFLSEIIPQGQSRGSVIDDTSESHQLLEKDATAAVGKISSFRGPFVFSHIDLFSGSGELWEWNLGIEESSKVVSSQTFDSLTLGNAHLNKQLDEHVKPSVVESYKLEHEHTQSLILGTLEEESEDETKSTDLSSAESVGNGSIGNIKDIIMEGNLTESSNEGSNIDSETSSSESSAQAQLAQTMEKDILLAHLLRLACAPKGALADALPEITSELLNLGIVSDGVRDMALKPSSSFDKIFDRVFGKHISSSKNLLFWKAYSEFGSQSSSAPSSRYLNDFEELQPLGHGGFGHVVLCKNKLDGRHYAVKKIRLKDKTLPVNDRILREVATLSRLQHQHVVRYYQAWYEAGDIGNHVNIAGNSKTGMSSSFSYNDTDSSEQFGHENKLESTYLYIQMEYCPRLQTVGLRFCGTADQALPRLRGALPADKSTRKALDEVSELFNYLRVWKIERHVFLDALMPPTEYYHRDLYFQIYLRKGSNHVSLMEGTLHAVGGRYDYLLQQMASSEYKSSPPGAVGTSIALETILLHSSVDNKYFRNDTGINVLVCSRGGGGLLFERMELVAELWEENIKAEFVPLCDPSLTEQYEYASEHDIKCLVVITDSGVSQNGSVKVRHLELKKGKEVDRENLVKFLSEAIATQFRNPSIWS